MRGWVGSFIHIFIENRAGCQPGISVTSHKPLLKNDLRRTGSTARSATRIPLLTFPLKFTRGYSHALELMRWLAPTICGSKELRRSRIKARFQKPGELPRLGHARNAPTIFGAKPRNEQATKEEKVRAGVGRALRTGPCVDGHGLTVEAGRLVLSPAIGRRDPTRDWLRRRPSFATTSRTLGRHHKAKMTVGVVPATLPAAMLLTPSSAWK